jgi:type IV secretory pathway TrbL component
MIDQGTTNASSEDSEDAGPRQRAIEAYEDARDRAVDTLSEAPLLALAGGIAAGALIAALLPRTSAETRAIRPTARRVKATAEAAFTAARKTSKQRFEELGFTRENGEDQLQRFLAGLKDTAKASADAALDAARNADKG